MAVPFRSRRKRDPARVSERDPKKNFGLMNNSEYKIVIYGIKKTETNPLRSADNSQDTSDE